MRAVSIFLGILFVWMSPHATAEEIASNSRHPIATILGTPIYLEDFPAPNQRDQAHAKIWSTLIDHYCETRACEPTEEEYTQFEVAMQKFRPQLPAGLSTSPAIQRDIARLLIRNWKFNKLLYAQYGGRVIWQQAGLEPLEAYETWLKEQEHAGTFIIQDPEFREKFWGYFRLPHTDVHEKDPFEKPWWLLKKPD